MFVIDSADTGACVGEHSPPSSGIIEKQRDISQVPDNYATGCAGMSLAGATVESDSERAGSGFTEYQSGRRVEVDVAYRDPFALDAVQSPVCSEASVTAEALVFL